MVPRSRPSARPPTPAVEMLDGGKAHDFRTKILKASLPGAATPRLILPRWIGEMALIFAALMLLRAANILPESFASTPHAFWIPVILVGVVYGTGPGLVAAFTASALKHFTEGEPVSPHLDYYGWYLASWHDPLLWLIAALVVGEIRRRHMGRAADLAEKAEESEAGRHSIAEHCVQLRTHIAALEHRLVTHKPLAEKALAAFVAMDRAPPGTAVALASKLMADLVSSSAMYVVLMERGRWQVAGTVLSAGWNCERFLPPDEDTLNAITREARILRATEQDDLAALGPQLAAAVPLRIPGGDVIGLMLMHDVDLEALDQFGDAGLAHFAAVLAGRLQAPDPTEVRTSGPRPLSSATALGGAQ